MAQRRMFNRAITESDLFTDMPPSAQALYFHLGMETDDDGFVVSPRRIQRALGATDDDMKLLIAKQFVIAFETGTLVVTHHKANNTLRNDRYKPTLCAEERERLESLPSGAYVLRENLLPSQEIEHSVGIPSGNQAKRELVARLSQDGDRSAAEAIVSRLSEMTARVEMGGEGRRLLRK